MASYITGAASSFEPELDVVGVYKIHRQSLSCRDASHTHLKPTPTTTTLTLTYLSLRSSRRSIRNGCKKSQKGCQYILRKSNPPENRDKRAKKRV